MHCGCGLDALATCVGSEGGREVPPGSGAGAGRQLQPQCSAQCVHCVQFSAGSVLRVNSVCSAVFAVHAVCSVGLVCSVCVG